MTVMNTVTQFLIQHEYVEADESIDASESLLERGIIDSVGIMKLVEFLEKTYNIKIDEDDLMPENFDSLDAIDGYVKSKIG